MNKLNDFFKDDDFKNWSEEEMDKYAEKNGFVKISVFTPDFKEKIEREGNNVVYETLLNPEYPKYANKKGTFILISYTSSAKYFLVKKGTSVWDDKHKCLSVIPSKYKKRGYPSSNFYFKELI